MATYWNDQREGEREVRRYKPPWTTRSRGHTYAIQFAICFGFFYTFFDPTELLGFVLFLFIHSTFVNNLLIMFQYSSTESMHNAQFSAMQFKILLSKMMHETTMSEAFISHVSCNEFSRLNGFSTQFIQSQVLYYHFHSKPISIAFVFPCVFRLQTNPSFLLSL